MFGDALLLDACLSALAALSRLLTLLMRDTKPMLRRVLDVLLSLLPPGVLSGVVALGMLLLDSAR